MKRITLFLIAITTAVNFSFPQTCANEICQLGENKYSCPRDCWLDTIYLLMPGGGRLDWAQDGSDRIAFDALGADGYYDVYAMNPDTSGKVCLTCGNALFPK